MPRKGKKGGWKKGGWKKGLPPSQPTQAPKKPAAWNSESAGSAGSAESTGSAGSTGYAGSAGSAGSAYFPSLSEASASQKKDNPKKRAPKDKSKWESAGQLFTTTSGAGAGYKYNQGEEKKDRDWVSKLCEALLSLEDMYQRAALLKAAVKEEKEELSFRRQLQEQLVNCVCKSSDCPKKVIDLEKLCPCCKSITKSIGRTKPCDKTYIGMCSDSFCCNVCDKIMENSETCDAARQWCEFMQLRREYYNLDPKMRKLVNAKIGFVEKAVKADSRNLGVALGMVLN